MATYVVSELKGDTLPYTSVYGHMYSYFNKDGFVALRLPEDARNAFLKKYKTTDCGRTGGYPIVIGQLHHFLR